MIPKKNLSQPSSIPQYDKLTQKIKQQKVRTIIKQIHPNTDPSTARTITYAGVEFEESEVGYIGVSDT